MHPVTAVIVILAFLLPMGYSGLCGALIMRFSTSGKSFKLRTFDEKGRPNGTMEFEGSPFEFFCCVLIVVASYAYFLWKFFEA